jgi:hypothetical protein
MIIVSLGADDWALRPDANMAPTVRPIPADLTNSRRLVAMTRLLDSNVGYELA